MVAQRHNIEYVNVTCSIHSQSGSNVLYNICHHPILCWLLSAGFWRHCVLSGRKQRRALPRHQSEENGNINLSKYFTSSSGDRTHNQSVLQSHLVPLRHDWTQVKYLFQMFILSLQNSAENGQQSDLTLGSLCLPCCVRDTT